MVIPRAVTIVVAAIGLLCSSPAAVPRANVLVVHDSRQSRRSPLLDCATCEAFDLAAGNLPARRYDVVVLDGHSLPPENVVGAPIDRIAGVFDRAAPRLLVANTCYGAELHLLERFFASSSRAETVMASAEPLPWPGSSIDDACLARRGAVPACFHVTAAVQTLSRGDVARLETHAMETLAAVRACRIAPPFARLRPLYLCIEDEAGPPAVVEVSFDEVSRDCGAKSSDDLRVVRCGLRIDAPSRDAAPAW